MFMCHDPVPDPQMPQAHKVLTVQPTCQLLPPEADVLCALCHSHFQLLLRHLGKRHGSGVGPQSSAPPQGPATRTQTGLEHHAKGKITHLCIGVPADHDGDRAWLTMAQQRVDIAQRHAAHGALADLHQLVTTPVEGQRTPETLGENRTRYRTVPSSHRKPLYSQP